MKQSTLARSVTPGAAVPRGATLMRRCACGTHLTAGSECSECGKQRLQRRAASGNATTQIAPEVHGVLSSAGQGLPATARAAMERGFGHDFSRVRVHTDAPAAASARAVDAAAYTVGRDVVFGAGRFAPQTPEGQRLLAHELAHVVQQEGLTMPAQDGLTMGAPGDAHEQQADRAADQVLRGARSPQLGASSGVALQRAPAGDAPLTSAGINLPTASIEIDADESISAGNPKLVDLAAQFKRGGAAAHIEVSANLSEKAAYGGEAERSERAELRSRMARIREALVSLGVPEDRLQVSSPTATSTSAKGQVSLDLRQGAGGLALPSLGLPGLGGTLGPPAPPTYGPKAVPPARPGNTPSLSDMLTLKIGPVTIELPKSVTAKLPIRLAHARSLVIELKAEAPAKFSFKLTLDGTPYVRVSAVAGAEYDTDKKVATGSAGLEIESVKTTCHAVNPDETRSKITAAGDKLMKAAHEYTATKEASKLIDAAGALGEMYDAVDQAKAACKQVPRFKVEFGVKGPLGSPPAGSDPSTQPPNYIGGTVTVPF